MIRHIVSWKFKDGFSETENTQNALIIKEKLENLSKIIEGIVELKVYITDVSSSDKDLILNSLFVDEKALSEYQVHPEHKKAGAFIGTVLQDRVCMDYYEE